MLLRLKRSHCQPGLKCSDYIHPHVVNKVADTCVQIRAANISRSAQVFATILLLQTVTNHTRYAKKQVWKAAEMKRLWQFKHGDFFFFYSKVDVLVLASWLHLL